MAVREEAILDVKEKLEGGVKGCVKISHPSGLENGNIVMENWEEEKIWEKKSSNVHQVVGNAEVKLVRVFRIGEREKKDLEGFRL